ncbi:flagellar P-ring protein precursor FlgI [Oceanicella actignis]|nr:flagellar P-ring protein precursor FlgI [Oceanicella actignis]
MNRLLFRLTAAMLLAWAGALPAAPGVMPPAPGVEGRGHGPNVRIKDLVDFEGVRGNDLVGYGLVVGLAGTGDGLRNSPFTEEALANLLERLGINVSGESFRPKNVAAVLVTAVLPPFARAGSKIDVTVSAIGDAKSLLGGTLIMTPLNAADGEIYAVAQGSIVAGGVLAEGAAAKVTLGVPTVATIPGGARVEREIDYSLASMPNIRLALREADFTTASRIAETINKTLPGAPAVMLDSGTVQVDVAGSGLSPAALISRIENLTVNPSVVARVVVDQRTGTVVMGGDVRISKVAISKGGLTIRIDETPTVSQPNPFAKNGETIVVPRTNIDVNQGGQGNLFVIDGNVTLDDLVAGLNMIGVTSSGLIDILMSLKSSGALHADFIVR